MIYFTHCEPGATLRSEVSFTSLAVHITIHDLGAERTLAELSLHASDPAAFADQLAKALLVGADDHRAAQ